MEYRKQKCVVCNGNKTKKIINYFKLVKCSQCNHSYLQYVPRNINSLYTKTYYSYNRKKSNEGLINVILSKLRQKITRYYYGDDKNLSFILKKYGSTPFIKYSPLKKKILDVGCGDGTFLKNLNDNKWDKYGIEINKHVLDKNNNTHIFINKNIPKEFCNKYFDVIRYWHVIEHIPNLNNSLIKSSNIIKENGVLIIAVPNIEGLNARIFKQHWFDLDIPRHINHFSPNSITLLLERNHFKIVKLKGYNQLNSIFYSINNINKNKIISFIILLIIFIPIIVCSKYFHMDNYLLVIAKKNNEK